MTDNFMTLMLKEELVNEAESTRKVLERLPEERLSWTPHEKSMTLGQLALHVAILPGELSEFFRELSREVPEVPLEEAESTKEILKRFEESVTKAEEILTSWSEKDLAAEWRMTHEGKTIMSGPRYSMVRTIMLNHWYHHRAQLTVYLRLLDVPVPGIYGPSADEQ
ncbi:DinB family protein [Alteribacillus sp. HJP-4]|uniref:DinB family protein n=1 Tax=Alteribacillus sp. HJP-4 TaxID=2775394 RepID=UPI0035CD198B